MSLYHVAILSIIHSVPERTYESRSRKLPSYWRACEARVGRVLNSRRLLSLKGFVLFFVSLISYCSFRLNCLQRENVTRHCLYFLSGQLINILRTNELQSGSCFIQFYSRFMFFAIFRGSVLVKRSNYDSWYGFKGPGHMMNIQTRWLFHTNLAARTRPLPHPPPPPPPLSQRERDRALVFA